MVRNKAQRLVLGLVGGSALCLASTASAQDAQRFRPAPGATNFMSVEGANVAPNFQLVPSLWLNWGKNPVVVRNDKTDKITEAIIESYTTANIMASMGFFDRLEIAADIPINYSSGEGVKNLKEDGVGLGDIGLTPKVRILGSRDDSGIGLALSMPIRLPTGAAKKGMSAAATTLNPKAIAEARMVHIFRLGVNFGYRWVNTNASTNPADTATVKTKGTEVGNEFTYGAAVGVHPGWDKMEILAELFGAAPAEDVQGGGNEKPIEGELGLRYYADNGIVATLGGGVGVVASYGTPDLRLLGGIAWEPHEKDTDGDGLMDSADKCPTDPEDKDGFEDSDGCPDNDNDQDGLVDQVDKCPDQPETKNGFEDEDGCPDTGDTDGDGLMDNVDKCPNDPEDKDNFQDEDGCPDPDNDADGVLDTADKCPNDAEDKDGFEDEDGCPEPDNDKDGILDVDDKCPLEPETINGVEDQDGCPDKGVTQVKLTASRIEILEKVYFDNDKDTIKPISFGLLGQVASTMKAHAEIAHIRVEGHTDRWGDPAHNLDLSQRRAESVRRYLIEQGVPADRLDAKGFGSTRPLDARKNFAADDKNRRVEFVLPDAAPGAVPVIESPAPAPAPAAPKAAEDAPAAPKAAEDAPPLAPAPATTP